jgi:hypothetical protein
LSKPPLFPHIRKAVERQFINYRPVMVAAIQTGFIARNREMVSFGFAA